MAGAAGLQGPGVSAPCSLLAVVFAHLPGRLQLPVTLLVDLPLPPRQHVLGRDVAGGAVQTDVVVVVNVNLHQSARIIERQRRSRPDAPPKITARTTMPPTEFLALQCHTIPLTGSRRKIGAGRVHTLRPAHRKPAPQLSGYGSIDISYVHEALHRERFVSV